jgi:hypothetical protein
MKKLSREGMKNLMGGNMPFSSCTDAGGTCTETCRNGLKYCSNGLGTC